LARILVTIYFLYTPRNYLDESSVDVVHVDVFLHGARQILEHARLTGAPHTSVHVAYIHTGMPASGLSVYLSI